MFVSHSVVPVQMSGKILLAVFYLLSQSPLLTILYLDLVFRLYECSGDDDDVCAIGERDCPNLVCDELGECDGGIYIVETYTDSEENCREVYELNCM